MEHVYLTSIVPSPKSNGKVRFAITTNAGVLTTFELTEAQASALSDQIIAALA